MEKEYDYIIIGAGIYGLYAAKILTDKNYRVAIVEREEKPFTKASYVNQARVHNGYHYPRSFSTAKKCSYYFERFCKDFSFAINDSYKSVYGIANNFSLTSAENFRQFCSNTGIPCNEISGKPYFCDGITEAVFETKEYIFDALKIRDWFISQLSGLKKLEFFFKSEIAGITIVSEKYHLVLNSGIKISSPAVLNATYANVNEVLQRFNFQSFSVKYELAEVILCEGGKNFNNLGITLMDGPFISVMPFGLSGIHTFTSVMYTPHQTFRKRLPEQKLIAKEITTAWPQMYQQAKKYLKNYSSLHYQNSLYTIKPILQTTELDDARPTIIKSFSKSPKFISVLSGKINNIYDLEKVLI